MDGETAWVTILASIALIAVVSFAYLAGKAEMREEIKTYGCESAMNAYLKK